MRSISRNFKNISKKKPLHGSYICLAEAVTGRNFSRKSLVKAMEELVPKEEYTKSEIKGLIDHLEHLTKRPVEGEFRA